MRHDARRRPLSWTTAASPTTGSLAEPPVSTADALALSSRQAYLRLLRLAGLLVVCLVVVTNPAGRATEVAPLWPALVGYVGAQAVAELGWWLRRHHDRGPNEVWLLTWMLLLDAAALIWVVDATGGLESLLRYLAFVHVAAVVLLSSYRTGIKVSAWYCLLLTEEAYRVPARLEDSTTAVRDVRLGAFLTALVLLTLVTAAASAVSERELHRRRLDLEALSELASRMEHATAPADIAHVLVARLADSFGLTRLVLVAAGPDAVVLAAGEGVARDVLPASVGERSLVTRAVACREPRLVRGLDPDADPWLAALLPAARNLVAVPLTAEAGPLCVLVFEYGGRAGARMERRMLTIIERMAAHTALSLRNALLLETMRTVAAVDGLTGIANRRTFEEELEREVARSVRTGEPVSLIMLDIDHFKVLNDTHGHQVGDDVLRQVAAVLCATAREYDVAARYGGEEFAVIVPASGRAEVAASAGRLLDALRAASTTVPVTASLGFATHPVDVTSARGLVESADQALYAAKRAGRDRVVGFGEASTARSPARRARRAGTVAAR